VRKILFVELVGIALALALLGWPGIAQGQGHISFGIGPSRADPNNPETFAYFVHTLSPGAVLADEARVQNSSDVPIVLKVYAADALTSIGGGAGFAHDGQELNGGRHWISLPLEEISLGPGEERIVPFTIEVPADASPGEHTAGLVVEAAPSEEIPVGEQAPSSGEDGAAFAVRVVNRAAVAVLIDVPGTRVAALETTRVCMKEQDDQGADFKVYVRNTGNVRVRGGGFLVIRDRKGTELASIPLKMGSVLPGDTSYVNVHHPVNLADGNYLLSATIDYGATRGNEVGETAFIEGVELKVKDGQPEIGCTTDESKPPEPGLAPPVTTVTTLTPAEEEGGPPIGRYAAYAAVFLALALGIVIFVRGLRKRQPSPP
jgi:hypothetical protein